MSGDSDLHSAAGKGDLVRLIDTLKLTNAKNINVKQNGMTPLLIAVEEGFDTNVMILLNNGADYNIKSSCGISALRHAIYSGNDLSVKYLVDRGAFEAEKKKNTIFHPIVEHGNVNMLNIFLKKANSKIYINELSENLKINPLSVAIIKKKPSFVKILLENGAELSKAEGTTPLHLAVNSRSVEIVSMILEKAPQFVSAVDNLGQTPFHLAVSKIKHEYEIIRLLMLYGADMDAEDNAGNTPFTLANTEILRFIQHVKSKRLYKPKIDVKKDSVSSDE